MLIHHCRDLMYSNKYDQSDHSQFPSCNHLRPLSIMQLLLLEVVQFVHHHVLRVLFSKIEGKNILGIIHINIKVIPKITYHTYSTSRNFNFISITHRVCIKRITTRTFQSIRTYVTLICTHRANTSCTQTKNNQNILFFIHHNLTQSNKKNKYRLHYYFLKQRSILFQTHKSEFYYKL